jgi:glycosyltransferase involved in cell wall biosynthesis
MYMGLPVVTTNVGGLPYLNKDGETVLMTEPYNINAFAGNMIRLLQEPDLGERLIPAARAFVEKEFNHFILCRKFVAQYQLVIDNYHTGKHISQDFLYGVQGRNGSETL